MKPYLLFAGDNYYPGAYMRDYQGDFATITEAMTAGMTKDGSSWDGPLFDWFCVVDHATMAVVVQDYQPWSVVPVPE